MKSLHFASLLLLLLVASAVAVVLVPHVSALHPVKHDHRFPPSRQKFCGKDCDCLVVKEHGEGGVLKIDDLDFMKDTVDTLIEKLPPWFGPRPARFVHSLDHTVLVKGMPLATQGVELMHTLVIYEAVGEDTGAVGMEKEEEDNLANVRLSQHEQAAMLEEEFDPFA